MRPRTVVFVEPPYFCWDRRMDRVRRYVRVGVREWLAVDPGRGTDAALAS